MHNDEKYQYAPISATANFYHAWHLLLFDMVQCDILVVRVAWTLFYRMHSFGFQIAVLSVNIPHCDKELTSLACMSHHCLQLICLPAIDWAQCFWNIAWDMYAWLVFLHLTAIGCCISRMTSAICFFVLWHICLFSTWMPVAFAVFFFFSFLSNCFLDQLFLCDMSAKIGYCIWQNISSGIF